MRGRSERARLTAIVVAVLALPVVAAAKQPGKPAGGAGSPPDQMDFFQSLSLGSNKDPIKISAESLELDYKGSVLTYSGNVNVTQGDVTLTSDRLAITYDRQAVQRAPAASGPAQSPAPAPDATLGGRRLGADADKIKEVVAEGHVRIRRGDRIAEGRRAVFDQAKQTIVLSEGAVLHEGPNQVAGDRIIVYLQEERSVVESGSNSRVSAVFYPNARGSGAPTPAVTPAVGPAAERRGRVQVGGGH